MKNIELSYYSTFKNLLINTDVNFIESILNNLINNAIKFTEYGSVHVNIEIEEINNTKFVVINIEDTGIGIAEEDLNIIFVEFRQVSEGIARSFEGTGLGLSLTKKYVNMLGGTISVKSKIGFGSTFTVKLPLNNTFENELNLLNSFQEVNEMIDNEFVNNDNPRKAVLIVEDDPISIKLVEVFLKDICLLEIANNALDAIKISSEKHFDAILMDINLGKGQDGIFP